MVTACRPCSQSGCRRRDRLCHALHTPSSDLTCRLQTSQHCEPCPTADYLQANTYTHTHVHTYTRHLIDTCRIHLNLINSDSDGSLRGKFLKSAMSKNLNHVNRGALGYGSEGVDDPECNRQWGRSTASA